MISIGGLDTAVHYQYIPEDHYRQDATFQEDVPEPQDYFTLRQNHSTSAKLLFYSAVCRTLLLFACYMVCNRKAIPRFLQSHMHHALMTICFIFCSLTVWRLLWDSEPPNNISYFAYWFFLTVDVIFILVMFRKLTNWYKAEWLPLIAGYILLAVGTSGKRVLR